MRPRWAIVSEVEVRAATPSDRDGLAAVVSSDATFKPDEQVVALELIDASLAASSDYELRVASLAGWVSGYICFGPTPMTLNTYDLYWIVVHAQARGQGVARALVAAMEALLRERGGGQIRVETSETEGYGAARQLYDRLGYREAGRLSNFYGPGDALLIYYKEL